MAPDQGEHGCQAREITLESGVRAIRLENELLAATILVDRGGDIFELISKPHNLDVLWKTPWGPQRPGGTQMPASSHTTFHETYPGGWQFIFPNGGAACVYNGAELGFHGEAAVSPWQSELTSGRDGAEVHLWLRLRRSPFLVERTLRVTPGRPLLQIHERITNQGGEPIAYMWGHHPAFGAPFLSDACRIETNARRLTADDAVYASPLNPLSLGQQVDWPRVEHDGQVIDLSRVPGEEAPRLLMAYLSEFTGDHGWYGITNSELGFGIGLVWPAAVFPFAWLWQEMHGSPGFPWYQSAYVMAIEPFTSYPGGLTTVMKKTGTHRTLAPGATAEVELSAVFYEAAEGISGIALDGTVAVNDQEER